jgi:HSP20 family protein
MKTIVRKPFSDFLFDDFFTQNRFENHSIKTNVKTNISKTENQYLIELLIPGVTKDDLIIEINKGTLAVKTKSQEEITDEVKTNYLRKEFDKIEFNKSFKLPENAEQEQISAEVKNGILSIAIPVAVPKKEIPTRVVIK